MANKVRGKGAKPIRRAPKTRRSLGLEPPPGRLAEDGGRAILRAVVDSALEDLGIIRVRAPESRADAGADRATEARTGISVVSQPADPLTDELGSRNSVLFKRMCDSRDRLVGIASRMLGEEPPMPSAAQGTDAAGRERTGALGSLYQQQQGLFDVLDSLDHQLYRLSNI